VKRVQDVDGDDEGDVISGPSQMVQTQTVESERRRLAGQKWAGVCAKSKLVWEHGFK
jgi:hypothetical protein